MGRESALRTAAALAALGAVVLLVVVIGRGGPAAPIAVVLLVLKFAFCRGVLRRGAGSFLALLLYEGAALVAAAAAGDVALGLRLVVAALALGTLGLLARSAPLFPSPNLPPR